MKKSGESTWKVMALMLMMVLALTPMIAVITVMTSEGGIVQTAFMSDRTANNIIPKPLSYEAGKGKFILNKDTSIYVKGNNEEETEELVKVAELLREKLSPATGYELKVIKGENTAKGNILLTTVGGEENQGTEGYKMVTDPSGVTITAFKPEGIFRGVQTLRQSLPADIDKSTIVKGVEWSIPAATIVDKPEYSYRGLMIDVARHFFTVDEVKRQIDLAAQYKINKVHLHLSDDQGWRLEIKKYPDLTLIGGSTEVGGGPGGYYTQEQFKDIVDYAAKRYVEIIPEFDMPGHTNAALASYGFLNPDGQKKPLYTGTKVGFSTFMTDSEETYNFIDDVIKEVSEISPSKYIHIGGDEADSTPKEGYDYFVGRVAKIAQKYGKEPIGWDPIDTSPEITSDVILQNWRDSNSAAVEKKMKIITSNASKAYLDMKYNKDTPYGLDWAGLIPVETAYNWDPTDFAPKELVLGLEAPLWTEFIEDQDQMDYMIYPRLPGYAEIGWTPKASRDWEEYKVRLKGQGSRLENEGVNYYKDPEIWGSTN